MTKKLYGTDPDQVPTNADLGTMAYQDSENVNLVKDSGAALTINRKTDDGDLALFRKDGSTVGGIGTATNGTLTFGDLSTNLTVAIGANDTSLKINGSVDAIYPGNAQTGDNRDALVDIGRSTVRFKDLYLSGGVYLGGTGSANHLNDYEEGTWNVTDGSGAGLTFSVTHNRYTKVGRFAMAHTRCQWPTTSSTALARLYLPFAADANSDNSTTGGVVTEQNYDGSVAITACINESDRVLFRTNGTTALTNAQLSGKLLRFTVTYFTP